MQWANSGQYRDAADCFSRAVRLEPDNVPARTGLADALAHLGRVEEAWREAESTVQRHPENAEAHFEFASVLVLKNQLPQASEHFKKAIALASDHPGAHQELALCESEMRLYREAIATYREGLHRYPLNFSLLNNLAWLLAVNPDASLRNGKEAVLLAERACQLTSYEKPVMIGTLAAADAQAGRFADAVATAERARRLASALGQDGVAKKNAELEELYRAGSAYVEEK
jgi:tetratricopeptide (TPR) repeat protein